MRSVTSILLAGLLGFTCSTAAHATDGAKNAAPNDAAPSALVTAFYHPDAALKRLVDSVYNAMTPQERASQMIMTASSTYEKLGYPFASAKKLVAGQVAANVVFLKGSTAEFRQEAATLNSLPAKLSPLLACDCEPTLLPGKFTDVTDILPASQQKDAATVAANTDKINKIVQKVGVQLNFAPVVDIAANKSVINRRSFGSNNADIVNLSSQFVTTTQQAGIGATLKHFPGHGAVTGDSHKQSVYIDGRLTELQNFKELIQSPEPPISVMVGHIVVKNNPQYATNGLPATLSRTIVTNLLRNELHFDGIITTDALNMEAAAKVPNADWKAAEAGVDLVLMPKDAALLNRNIVTALGKQDALSKQLETSIKRIIRFKLVSRS